MGSSKARQKWNNEPMAHERIGDSNKFVRLYESLLTSEPFKALSPEAKLLFLYIKREFVGSQNMKEKDTVKLPYEQIVELTGITRCRIRKRIEELEDFGFIEVTTDWGKIRRINKYHFVSTWKNISVPKVQGERRRRAEAEAKAKKNAKDYKALLEKKNAPTTDSLMSAKASKGNPQGMVDI